MRFLEFTLKEEFTLNVPRSNRGVDAANVQKALDALGYDIGSTGVDGIIGPRTRAAIRKFQQDNPPLAVDGAFGRNTREVMLQKLRDANKLSSLTSVTAADIASSQASAPTGYADTGTATTGRSEGRVEQLQQDVAEIRKLPISRRLMDVLQKAAEEVKVNVVVTSGGQMPMSDYERAPGRKTNSGGRSPTYYLDGRPVRKGSTRHDGGNAADLYITDGGRKVKLDTPLMNSFITACFKHGAEGGGGSPGYMGDTTVHIDVVGTRQGGGRYWSSTNQFIAALNRGLTARNQA
jgi:peptidoglycan hydrolase-like protein with peptidoglycan-binding domain